MRKDVYNSWEEKIIEVLKKNKNMKITDLAKALKTSFVTIGRYVDMMEEKRIVKSEYIGNKRILRVKNGSIRLNNCRKRLYNNMEVKNG